MAFISENEFMNTLFGEVFKKLTNNGDPASLGPNNFIAWEPIATVLDKQAFDYAVKGFFGNPEKKEGMTDEEYNELRSSSKYSKYAYAAEFAKIADQIHVPVPEKASDNARKFTVFNSEPANSVSQVFGDLLEFCVVKDSKIDPKVEKKIETFRKKIFTIKKLTNPDFDDASVEHPEDNPKFIFQSFPSPKYIKYLEYEALYSDAEKQLTDLQIRVDNGEGDAMTEMTINGSSYKRRRDDALKRWETLGYKGELEKVFNYIDEIESSNFISIKKKYESEFLAGRRTALGGTDTYYFSSPFPANILNNSSGWQSFSFTKSEFTTASSKNKHSWSAGANWLGLFGASGSGSHSTINSQLDFSDFQLSFKCSKCYVSRGWFGLNFIKSRFWKFAKHSPQVANNQIISDGNGKGLLPCVSTELYFIKDLKIGFTKGSNSYKKIEDHISAGLDLNIGPFTLGGKYAYDKENVNTERKREGQHETAEGILLIGRKFNVLDLSPNPLPTIQDNEWVEVN